MTDFENPFTPLEKTDAHMVMLDNDDLPSLITFVRLHQNLQKHIDLLTDQKSSTRKKIDRIADAIGEADSKGHLVVSIDDEQSGVSKVTRQRRVSKNFDQPSAYDILVAKNLEERCTKQVTVLDEEAIMSAYNEGLLTDEDIEKMFPEKVTWATIIK